MSDFPLTVSGSYLVDHLREQDRQNQLNRMKELMRDRRGEDERR